VTEGIFYLVYILIIKQAFIVQKNTLTPAQIARLTQQFERCKAQLLQLSWISQGSVFQTQNGTWCWTRKVKAKTVTVALSAQQAELFEQAIAQQRKLTALLAKMRDISQTFLLQSVPGPLRRKRSKPS
jgi:uncharacterized protein DUF6788